ncbi:MAG: Crp/Fnr family transcriptional regulator [Myxococcales bacterium]|nr:Crp/Fnr family transcriptional regulator [Myxococcales bacterium]
MRASREFPVGEVLFREGDAGSEMYVIQSGRVRVTKKVAGGDFPIAMLGRGEFLGEMAILNNKPRTATATVVEPASCLVIDAKTLESMITNNSEIAMRLVKKLAARLDAADALVQILMHPDPKARVLMGLRRHAEAFGEQTEEGIRLDLPTSTLAREVGADVEQVDEVLARLRRLRIVSDDGGRVVISDIGRLLEFLEFIEMPRRFEA